MIIVLIRSVSSILLTHIFSFLCVLIMDGVLVSSLLFLKRNLVSTIIDELIVVLSVSVSQRSDIALDKDDEEKLDSKSDNYHKVNIG